MLMRDLLFALSLAAVAVGAVLLAPQPCAATSARVCAPSESAIVPSTHPATRHIDHD